VCPLEAAAVFQKLEAFFLLERQSGATPRLEISFDEVYVVILSILRNLRIDAIRPG
jgi:hypothetical protein